MHCAAVEVPDAVCWREGRADSHGHVVWEQYIKLDDFDLARERHSYFRK